MLCSNEKKLNYKKKLNYIFLSQIQNKIINGIRITRRVPVSVPYSTVVTTKEQMMNEITNNCSFKLQLKMLDLNQDDIPKVKY